MSDMKKTRAEVLEYLKNNLDRFNREYGVDRIGVFGSVARDEATEESDVDLLVEMPHPTFRHYMHLKFEIEEALGVSVDLVTQGAVKEFLRSTIEQEVIYA